MSLRPLRSLSELNDEYERVILPDGNQALRERQTRAQAKIQALRAQIRNEKLRNTLVSLSEEVGKSTNLKRTPEITKTRETLNPDQAINNSPGHQLKEKQNKLALNNNSYTANSNDTDSLMNSPAQAITVNETSAIEKQIMNNSATERHVIPNESEKYVPKSAKLNALNLRRLLFGEPVNK